MEAGENIYTATKDGMGSTSFKLARAVDLDFLGKSSNLFRNRFKLIRATVICDPNCSLAEQIF
jgi:hypothetical protein